MQNKPQEALRHLEAAVREDPAHVQAFLYLGIAYLQVNRVDDAIAAYKQVLPRGGNETARIAFNLGNAYFTKGDQAQAHAYYTQAINSDPSFASAYLNRANSLVKTGELKAAVTDYEAFLSLAPSSPKREQVMRLLAFIRDEFAREEQLRIMEEQRLVMEEQRRLMEEEAAREAARLETERRLRLLEEVTQSLHAAAGDSTGLSAGTENVYDYDGEFELE
jgi:tetratricopeptide (TPR) repeat protein